MTRTILRISGADRLGFLQGLVSNTVPEVEGEITYAALLTPQGKYLADFFLLAQDGAILLDTASDLAPSLVQRLGMYRLRSDVAIDPTDLMVTCGFDGAPAGALQDPRHEQMGWRLYGDEGGTPDGYDIRRVAHLVPQSGVELIPNESFILEHNFEALNGVDFRKGCYVGQEVTARMKHKTELRKGLARVRLSEPVPVGTEITADGKTVGTVYTQANGDALAYVRFDRATGEMMAAGAVVALT
ncbi:MAG: folate-binding protein [Pseudomonadota bacterium]